MWAIYRSRGGTDQKQRPDIATYLLDRLEGHLYRRRPGLLVMTPYALDLDWVSHIDLSSKKDITLLNEVIDTLRTFARRYMGDIAFDSLVIGESWICFALAWHIPDD